MPCNSYLSFDIFAADEALPIKNATVRVTGQDGNVYILTTDVSGRTRLLCMDAPPKEESLDPNFVGNPFSTCNATVTAENFTPVTIEGIQMFEGVHSIEPVEMVPALQGLVFPQNNERVAIPNISILQSPESEPEYFNGTPRILNEVYIPEFIIVHLGRPDNASAKNVTVSFPNYIKNVASSEIYPTWPENSLRANIYAQISLTLNRIFTEWYPSRGYNFDITNSTSFDQAYVHGRNIFENISIIVDEIFNEYIVKKGTINPYFAEYCNGTTATCNGMSQWGTVYLAENGYSPLSILRYYYGLDIELTSTDKIQAVQASYPGTPLRLGTVSESVRIISNQLNRIRLNFPAIPLIPNVSTTFNSTVEAAVRMFQTIFNITPDGIVGKATWYRISYIFVAVTRLAELNSEGIQEELPPSRPTAVLKEGSTGDIVKLAQYFLAVVAKYNSFVRPLAIDGKFGPGTKASVIDFQKAYGLVADGIIGPKTWDVLYAQFIGVVNSTGLAIGYPGYLIKEGSRGDNVLIMQKYLNVIGTHHRTIPPVIADGIFGPRTKQAVVAFQNIFGLTPDGIIGKNTWDRIVTVRLLY